MDLQSLCGLEIAIPTGHGIDFLFLISLGLTGSLHCAGMCGGISCSYAVPVYQRFPKKLWKYHASYFFGRLLAYSWIGALMGSLGLGMAFLISPFEKWQHLGIWMAGLIMILGGLSSLLEQRWPQVLNKRLIQLTDLLLSPIRSLHVASGPYKAVPLGMVSGILPCGLMWAVEIRAFASQSPWVGMLMMAIFCLVTTPSVLLASTIMAKVSPHLRYRSTQLAGVFVILMGIHLILQHA